MLNAMECWRHAERDFLGWVDHTGATTTSQVPEPDVMCRPRGLLRCLIDASMFLAQEKRWVWRSFILGRWGFFGMHE